MFESPLEKREMMKSGSLHPTLSATYLAALLAHQWPATASDARPPCNPSTQRPQTLLPAVYLCTVDVGSLSQHVVHQIHYASLPQVPGSAANPAAACACGAAAACSTSEVPSRSSGVSSTVPSAVLHTTVPPRSAANCSTVPARWRGSRAGVWARAIAQRWNTNCV